MFISIIIPAYNEEEAINKFHELLIPEIKKIKPNKYEIIYINDGSTDNTLKMLKEITNKNNNVKIINFSRNFGKEIATTAGINNASGDAIIIMDADGQHPPKKIHEFIEKWQNGAQVVVGIRNSNQKEGLIKKWGSALFYKLFNASSDANLVPRSTDFRLIDKVVKAEFTKFTERQRITRGLIDWLGFKREFVTFEAPARIAGEASYKTSQLFKLAMNSFVSLSLKPLFFFGWVGAFITILSSFLGIFILIEQIILKDPLSIHFSGSAVLGLLVSFLVGLVLISQSIIAIYISHIHTQSQNRPLYVIDKTTSVGLFNN